MKLTTDDPKTVLYFFICFVALSFLVMAMI